MTTSIRRAAVICTAAIVLGLSAGAFAGVRMNGSNGAGVIWLDIPAIYASSA